MDCSSFRQLILTMEGEPSFLRRETRRWSGSAELLAFQGSVHQLRIPQGCSPNPTAPAAKHAISAKFCHVQNIPLFNVL